MTTPAALGPDYDPDVWKLGYQSRQFGVCGDAPDDAASVLSGLANPPAEMVTAAESTPEHDTHATTQ